VPYVSKDLIESTWQSVGASSGPEILRAQKKHRNSQDALSKFVYEDFLALREDAAGVGLFVFHVVVESFSRTQRRPKRVKWSQIKAASADQTTCLEFNPQQVCDSPEPYVMRYVCEALYEPEPDDVVLSENEREHLYCILEVVVFCLHSACRRKWQ